MNIFRRNRERSACEGVMLRLPGLIKKNEQYIIDCRRQIHRTAETGGREKRTSAFIRGEAEKLGLPVESVSTTGLLVTLDTGRKGSRVALRADIDALPISENPCNLKGPRSVVSEDPGVSHMCGHDAHAAMLLGAMKTLCEVKDELCGAIYFCFEEGEENGTGFGGMVAALEERNANTVFAIHTASWLEHGLIEVGTGPVMAGVQELDATFIGRGGHGSRPDLSINPVTAAAAAVCELSAAFNGQMDPLDQMTLGITAINGGKTANAFPDTTRVLGSIRFFSAEAGKRALDLTKKVFSRTAEIHGCKVDFGPVMSVYLLPTVNDAEAAEFARRTFAKVLPEGSIVPGVKRFGSETFSHYLAEFKGVYAHLGTGNEELGTTAEHHNEHFDVDESALATGALCYCAYAAAAAADVGIAGWTWKEAPVTAYDDEDDGSAEPDASDTQAEPLMAKTGAPKYSVDTKISVLMKSEAAKAAVDSVIKGVVTHPQIKFVKGMSIRKAAGLVPDMVTPEILRQLDEALAKVEE